MGVLYDYFRASGRDTAARSGTMSGGPVRVGEGSRGFDGVSLTSIDPIVMVGQLVAALAGAEWTVNTVRTTDVWSPEAEEWPGMSEGEPPPADWEGSQGPWVEELDDQVRNLLADVDDFRVAELADGWAQIEEFNGSATGEELQSIVAALIGLARRAREADDHIYCWSCL